MARLVSLGFELNSNTAGVEWTNITGSPTIQTTTVRSGTYAGQTSSLSANTPKGWMYQFASTTLTGSFFARVAFRFATLPNATSTIFFIGDFNTIIGSSVIGGIKLKSDGTLILTNQNTQVGLASSALTSDTWYILELKVTAAGAGASTLEARLNESVFATSSSQTLATNGVESVAIGGNLDSLNDTATAGNFFFDDLAVNNTGGSSQTGYPGTAKLVSLRPTGMGTQASGSSPWAVGVGGTAGTANNYTRVQEVRPDDLTTYNKRTATGTFIDDFSVTSTTTAGIGASDTITLVQVSARVGATSTSATGRTGILRIQGQDNGTVLQSSAVGWNRNGFVTNTVTAPANPPLTAYTNPQTGTDWTPSTIDTMRIGYRNGTSSSNEIRVSAIWAIVEYVPSAVQTLTTTHTTDAFKRSFIPITHTADASKAAAVSKTHTTDSLKRVERTASFTTDASKAAAHTLSFTTDTFLRAQPTRSHTTDALKRAIRTTVHLTDTSLRAIVTTTHDTDSLTKTSPVTSHTTDALKRAGIPLTHTTDALKLAVTTTTQTTDSMLHLEATLTHTTDTYLSSALQVFTLEYATDALLRAAISIVQMTTSTIKRELAQLHFTDSLLLAIVTASHTTDALQRFEIEKSHTTDALVRVTVTLSHTIDTLKRAVVSPIHTTDTYLVMANTYLLSFTSDGRLELAVLGEWSETWDWTISDFTKTHATDALMHSSPAPIHTTDSLKRSETALTHTTDALARAVATLGHTTDAALWAQVELTHTTDALKRGTATLSHTTDAQLLREGLSITHDTDALLFAVAALTHDTDSFLRGAHTLTHTADAYTKIFLVTHDTDALKGKKHDYEIKFILVDGRFALQLVKWIYTRL